MNFRLLSVLYHQVHAVDCMSKTPLLGFSLENNAEFAALLITYSLLILTLVTQFIQMWRGERRTEISLLKCNEYAGPL